MFDITKAGKGWLKHKSDGAFLPWSHFFKDFVGATIPTSFSWRSSCPPLSNQDGIPSCCSNASSYLQAFNAKQTRGFNDLMSWSFVWANLKTHNITGSTVIDNCQTIQNLGVCEESYYPRDPAIANNFDKSKISVDAYSNALHNKIKTFFSVQANSIKQAILQAPIMITVQGNDVSWANPGKTPIVYCGDNNAVWGHALALIGYDINGNWECANWWGNNFGDNGFVWLDKNYPLMSMTSFSELPAGFDIKALLVKVDNLPAIYWIVDSVAYPIGDWNTYLALFNDIQGKFIHQISSSVFNYPIGNTIWCH